LSTLNGYGQRRLATSSHNPTGTVAAWIHDPVGPISALKGDQQCRTPRLVKRSEPSSAV
jgi:hypothetical protein